MNWRLRTRTLEADHPLVMGVVNVTSDSFSDGGDFTHADLAISHGRALVEAGASIVDIGGESTRPGSEEISTQVELDRVLPVIGSLADDGVVVSVDTSKVDVARAAVDAGAEIINDVTGFRDPAMRQLAADLGAGVVVMHMAGNPRTMQQHPHYVDVVAEVCEFLVAQAKLLESQGVGRDQVCVDPGIGFGKSVDHNLALLANTSRLASLGYPLLVGASRKRFLGTLLDLDDARDRDGATAVVSGLVTYLGASVVRVHDVVASRQAVLLCSAIVSKT